MQTKQGLLVGMLLANAIACVTALMGLFSATLFINGLLMLVMGAIMFFSPRQRKLPSSGLTSQERVATVLQLNSSIQELAASVRSNLLRTALLRGCELIPQIMDYTQQHDSDNLSTTAAQIGVYLESVRTALGTYVSTQNSPEAGTHRRLWEDGKILGQFPEFALTSLRQLEAGEAALYRANLAVLKPMSTQGIRR